MAREGNVRIAFYQEIFRIPDEKLIVKAKITTAATRKGKPFFPAGLITEMGLG
jgi:acyl-CoA thioesterase FadM